MADDDRFMVASLRIWGNIVKTWATGEDHLPDVKDKSYLKRPTEISELRDLLTTAGAGPILPARYTKLTIVESPDNNTLVIKLPEKKALQEAEADVEAGLGYQPPDLYKDVFGAHDLDPAASPADIEQQLSVHAMSIGDYTIRNCR